MYASRDVTFLKTQERSERVRVQVEEDIETPNEMLVSEDAAVSETKLKSESDVEETVTGEDKMVGRDSKSENVERKPKNNVPEQLHCSKHNRRPTARNDDTRFDVTSYARRKAPEKVSDVTLHGDGGDKSKIVNYRGVSFYQRQG